MQGDQPAQEVQQEAPAPVPEKKADKNQVR